MTTSTRDPEQLGGKRRAFDFRPGQYRPKNVRTGIIFSVLALIFLWIIYTKPSLPLLSSSGQTFSAVVDNGANIQPGYTPVRVQGVDVGDVTAVGPTASGRGETITMSLKPGANINLKDDASLSVRWRTLLGRNMYIDLHPGSASASPLGGTTIPITRTSTQVELDQVLEPFNATGRRSVQTMLQQFHQGLSDPAAVGATVQNLAPAMNNLGPGIQSVRGTQQGDLTGLISSTSRVMDELSRNEAALGGLVDNGDVALGVTAARSADLASTIQGAPSALDQTNAAMARLRGTLDVVDPLAANLRPGARELGPAVPQVNDLLSTARPLLNRLVPLARDLYPSVVRLRQVARLGVPEIASLSNVIDNTNNSIIPFLNRTDPETKLKNWQAIGPAVASASSAISWGDAEGPVADFEGGAGESVLADSPCQTQITNPYVTTLQGKLDCAVVSQVLAGLFSGTPPASMRMLNSPVAQSLVDKVLSGTKKISLLVKGRHR